MYRINLVVGDWSDDGHGKTSTFNFECSHSCTDVQNAYSSGADKDTLKTLEDIASKYDSNVLKERHIIALKGIGYPFDMLENGEDKGDIYINADEFVDIYWFIVQRGNPEITYTSVDSDDINIGGYGFFY